MVTRAPAVRKHLSADALFGVLRTDFAAMTDHRPGDPDISLPDALMSAFAMFSLKSPSLLAFDQERTEGNVQRVYGIERVPCDTRMREILDPVDPASLRPLFRHGYAVAPNLLARQCDIDEPNHAWVGDITYVWTTEGWLYVSTLLDVYARKVVGWAMSSRIDTTLVQDA